MLSSLCSPPRTRGRPPPQEATVKREALPGTHRRPAWARCATILRPFLLRCHRRCRQQKIAGAAPGETASAQQQGPPVAHCGQPLAAWQAIDGPGPRGETRSPPFNHLSAVTPRPRQCSPHACTRRWATDRGLLTKTRPNRSGGLTKAGAERPPRLPPRVGWGPPRWGRGRWEGREGLYRAPVITVQNFIAQLARFLQPIINE